MTRAPRSPRARLRSLESAKIAPACSAGYTNLSEQVILLANETIDHERPKLTPLSLKQQQVCFPRPMRKIEVSESLVATVVNEEEGGTRKFGKQCYVP